MNKIDKFYEVKNLLQCPLCGKKIRFHAGGLVCKKEHRFDISSKGYVNLLQASKPLKGYDLAFFESRSRFMNAGYYGHVGEAVCEQAAKRCGRTAEQAVIVDAGCGEGYYSKRLAEQTDAQILAFDIASDAIKVAAKSDLPVKWLISDITNIPIKDASADCVLDVFTPANYKEFCRILKDDGIVIKVIPGARHMGELRDAASSLLRSKEYSNEEVLDYFLEHFELAERIPVSKTMPIAPEDLEDLIKMTPLLFDVDKSKLDVSAVTEITVEAEVLVGRKK